MRCCCHLGFGVGGFAALGLTMLLMTLTRQLMTERSMDSHLLLGAVGWACRRAQPLLLKSLSRKALRKICDTKSRKNIQKNYSDLMLSAAFKYLPITLGFVQGFVQYFSQLNAGMAIF